MHISQSYSCIPNIVYKLVIVNKEEKPDYIISTSVNLTACVVTNIVTSSCKQASQVERTSVL